MLLNVEIYLKLAPTFGAHVGTSTLALRTRPRRCTSLHYHHQKLNYPCREANLHAEPPTDQNSIALTTWPLVQGLPTVFFFFLAKYGLIFATWNNAVSQ